MMLCVAVQAQFLPANKVATRVLTRDILQRWIDTNKAIQKEQSLIEDMLPTEAEAKAFEFLSIVEQDRLVNNYLQRKGKFEPLNGQMLKLGWTGVADYMRTSTQIGNAIAADLQAEMVAKMTPDQARAVMEKADPAIKLVPTADLQFVRANKAIISQHIQSFSAASP